MQLSVSFGAPVGAGVIIALDDTTCPLGEVAAVAEWLAGESIGQCGPCVFGLPSLAGAVHAVLAGERQAPGELRRRAGLLPGRGACAHPDGAARFVASALELFAADGRAHRHGGCGRAIRGALPLPGQRPR